ncbi:Conserved_hypothetical protein [Hexamita inflata]|uniref:HNH nuclease domain-containing protein n=1 Tax=Hexamita inflata TaxID=28002 RepID=A0AA86PNY1_9EUKA|nr:Conserved hypothetical protein [Hexamita inflata]
MDLYQFEDLKDYENDYEINRVGQIKCKRNNKIISQSINCGYYKCTLNRESKQVHRLLALQFIQNPMNLEQVDHINGDRLDYRLQNLRWVTRGQNIKNQNGRNGELFQFVDYLPDDVVEVEIYGQYQLQDYYWSQLENKLYFYNGARIRIMIQRSSSSNTIIFACRDINNVSMQISLTSLQKGLYNNQ